jgi:uncharacterized membrane protein
MRTLDPGRHAQVMTSTSQISPRRLAWLRRELAQWQEEGIVDVPVAERIAARYAAGRRMVLGRLALGLGAAFVGIGLIWLVAANLDQLSPWTRIVGVTAVWLGAVLIAEVLANRNGPAPAIATARVVAAIAAGAVVFQAAQSLQVPAYTSGLLGVWAGGALAYAYATAGAGPLVVAIVTGTGWFAWFVGERTDDAALVAASLVLAAAVATAVTVLHERHWRPSFARPWRNVGALLALVGLFVVALPNTDRPQSVPLPFWVGLAAVVLIGGTAVALGDRQGRREVLAIGAVAAATVTLLAWSPSGVAGQSGLTATQLIHAIAATAVYVLAATWFAAVGAFHDAAHLMTVSTGALVVFVTVQSFAIFAPLLSGAALFLVLGVVFLVTGALVIRGRRRLVATVSEVTR